MELNKKWWTPVNWDDFSNEQRRKTIVWMEEHLGKYFGLEANYCNPYAKRPVARNRRFSTLKEFDEYSIGFYPNRMMETLVNILGCWNPIRFSMFHVEAFPMKEPYFIDYAGNCHHSEEDCKKADEEFKRLFSDLFNMVGEKKMNKLKEKKSQSAMEYRLIAPNGEQAETYDKLERAIDRAKHMSSFYFNGIFGGDERIWNYCDFKNLDFTKENSFEMPKIKQTSRFLYEFKDTSYIDRLSNPEQDIEFQKFLEEL